MLNFWNAILAAIYSYAICASTIVFLHCFYDAGFLWNKKKALLILAGAVVEAVLTFAFGSDMFWLGLFIYVAYGILAVSDYKGKKVKAAWRFIVYSVFLQLLITWGLSMIPICLSQEFYDVFEAVSLTGDMSRLLTLVQEEPKMTLVLNGICSLVFVGIFFLIYPVYRKGIIIQCEKKVTLLTIVSFVLGLIVSSVVMSQVFFEQIRMLLFAFTLLFIILSILCPVFIYYTCISEHYRRRTIIQEQHMEAELLHFEQYRQAQEETARFRHDIRNNLRCLREMLQQEKSEEALEYLSNLLDVAGNLSAKYVTGDSLLDSIVSVKAQTMEQHKIRFDLDGVLAGGLSWKPMDVCNVFANALDNAIEACQKVAPEERSISMKIKSTSQFWLIAIENPVAAPVDVTKLFQKNSGYTSKTDASQHGIGTYNMKYTVEAYGAMLRAECNDETFVLEIVIDKRSLETASVK